ncbi:MAG: preprotein translocase subunit SecE [Promethearchaeota archaeon]
MPKKKESSNQTLVLGVLALIFGAIGFFIDLYLIIPIIAILCGFFAMKGRGLGKVLGIIGLILGIIALVLGIIGLVQHGIHALASVFT